MDHETIERLNTAKTDEALRLGIEAAASPEQATKYRKSRAEWERYARLWIRDCGAFREAHFTPGTGPSFKMLLEEAFIVGQHTTAAVEARRAQMVAEDADKDRDAAAGEVVLLPPIVVEDEAGGLVAEEPDQTARRSVREARKAKEKREAAK